MAPSQSSTTNGIYPPSLAARIETCLSGISRGAVYSIQRFLFPSIRLQFNSCDSNIQKRVQSSAWSCFDATEQGLSERNRQNTKIASSGHSSVIAEQLPQRPNGLNMFRDFDFLCCTGDPVRQKAGETLVTATELCPMYGSTEAFQVAQLGSKDSQ